MPSDAKKKRAQDKKEAAKGRSQKKPVAGKPVIGDVGEDDNASESNNDNVEDNAINGVVVNGNGCITKKTGKKGASGCNGTSGEENKRDNDFEGSDDESQAKSVNKLAYDLQHIDLLCDQVAKNRAVTGVLASHPDARDVHIQSIGITFHGMEILTDSKLELNNGRRYGLIGLNGCGKSTLMACLANRELPIPKHVDIFLLQREMEPSDKTAIQCVIEVNEERVLLEKEADHLASDNSDEAQERLMDIYDRLEELDIDKAEVRAANILHGLGFTWEMQQKKVKNFSGGWRMRIALARALFVKPSWLLLDEPTNHLDLNACVWLEEELKKYKRVLMVISHSQDFLNGVCTNIIHMRRQHLKYYTGNYDQYINTRMELEENQMKRFKWEQDQMANMKDYIARFGHGSKKLARQAQSKEKTLKKMVDGGLTEKVDADRTLTFYFPDCGTIPPPVIMVQNVSFGYSSDKPLIYHNIDFGVDLDTRVALVGPNGAGKSTLLKLIGGELHPTDGIIRRHSHVRIGRYHQHLHEMLDVTMSALDWMMKCYPEIKERDDMRKILGRYGLSGQQQICEIQCLSDGQRCRIIFAWLANQSPHLLLLDEPTNHLDLETIDTLADAINDFNGGVMLVSHDFRLISQVTDEIWVCDHGKVTKWEGDIFSYKKCLVKDIAKESAARN